MTEQQKSEQPLGTPDTGAHDKKHGEKLNSGGSPAQPGTGHETGQADAHGAEDGRPKGDRH